MPSLLEKEATVAINRESLIGVLAKVASIVPTRSPKPVLQLVRLTADPDTGAYLEGTDLEVGIRHRLIGVEVDRRIEVLLAPGRVGSILRDAEDETVTITLVEGDDGTKGVRVAGRRWKFSLPTEDPDLFPAVPAFEARDFHVVAAADLARLIKRTVFATDVESTRYALGGCLVEPGAETLTLVGTDGRRLAHQTVPAEVEGNGLGPGQAVIPAKALKLILKTLDPHDPPAHLAYHRPKDTTPAPAAFLVRTGDAEIWSRLIEGRFPRYQDIFPSQCETVVTVEAGELHDVSSQAKNVTSDESRGVDYHFDGDTLKLVAKAADVGSGDCEVSIVTLSGPKQLITFDVRFMVDALKEVDRKAVLRAEMIDAKNAVVLRTEDSFRYVVMPLTRDS